METKFKIKDKVYWVDNSYNKREGIVDYIDEEFIKVKSERGTLWNFFLDGKGYHTDLIPRLSFTPFTIELKGFSQERPLLQIEIDTVVYVRDRKNEMWCMRYFSHFENDKIYTFNIQKKSTETKETINWNYWSLENPLINK